LLGALLFGTLLLLEGIWRFKIAGRESDSAFRAPALQALLWLCLVAGAIGMQWTNFRWTGLLLVMAALLLPRRKKAPPDEDDEANKPAVAPSTGGESKP